jgi:hypothetical protein
VGTKPTTLAMVASALALTRLIRKHECWIAAHSSKVGAYFREKSVPPRDTQFFAKRVQRFLIDDTQRAATTTPSL